MKNYAIEVKNLLSDPVRLVELLGWGEGAKRQPRGLHIRCPVHSERNASCSIRIADSGHIGINCFGCDFSGDVLTAIAQAYGLSLSSNFKEVLAVGAELARDYALAEEIRGGSKSEMPERKPVPRPKPIENPREYPKRVSLIGFWKSLKPVESDAGASAMLRERAISPPDLDAAGLARVLGASTPAPDWASYRGRFWGSTGHRLILPVWDANGAFSSVRAWRVTEGETPKRLPPAGLRAAGLCMANRPAVMMLAGRETPKSLLFVEGEPDFLTWATRTDAAVIGVGSGMWTTGHAKKVSIETEVIIKTHRDDAGERYAEGLIKTLTTEHRIFR